MEAIRFFQFWYRYRALGLRRCWRVRKDFKNLVKYFAYKVKGEM